MLVSGSFDMLHGGHIAFLEEAATYGDLTVCLASDETVRKLKGRLPICSENERKYIRDSADGWKMSVAGGGGYLTLLTDRDIPGAIRITIRRPS